MNNIFKPIDTHNNTIHHLEVLPSDATSKKKRLENKLPEVLFITSYPPRECGIATYSQDLFRALNNKFSKSFSLKICALENTNNFNHYPEEVKFILDTNNANQYIQLAYDINTDENINFVIVQHEFGLFQQDDELAFTQFLYRITKPIIIVFHTVLPSPTETLMFKVRDIAMACKAVIVMTKNAAQILKDDYHIPNQNIVVIPHGVHLVAHLDKNILKAKYGLSNKKVLATFGLLSSGKSIETTLNALTAVVKENKDVVFLIIGKTHPSVVKHEGEKYRLMLQEKVMALHLEKHVRFINNYLPLDDLLEYLQLTDIYLFTSKDPNQAVSGTFSYAMSCGCPIISTPIPHALEVLKKDSGFIFDFENSDQLALAINRLLADEPLRNAISKSALQTIASSAWENAAIAHAQLIMKIIDDEKEEINDTQKLQLNYRIPSIQLAHIKKMTTPFGIIQFSKINEPDLETGYTLDDNARALIAMCMHYELTGNEDDVAYINIYLNFIKYCHQTEGYFLNYVDSNKRFTLQNDETNLADSNGRAIWALGFLLSKSYLFSTEIILEAEALMQQALGKIDRFHATRAMAFAIKGLYYYNLEKKSLVVSKLVETLANRLMQMFLHESEHYWQWYESYLTYANSILPEAMLCAWLETGNMAYKEIAKSSFDFLLLVTFNENGIKVISNKSWMQKGQKTATHGEQPIDVAYTIVALHKFYEVFKDESYLHKIKIGFNWFLGNNHLHQIIYNPCTGGCYDGLEDIHVNLNQGAESTVSYLIARLTVEKHFKTILNPANQFKKENSFSLAVA